MEFYITPDKRQKCEQVIDKTFSKFTAKPKVSYETVKKLVTKDKDQYEIELLKVTIEDIQQNEWTLVATVNYREDAMLVVDDSLFKSIPESLGLSYTKCDFCGSTHSNRKESHILYNSSKDEWMQVGTACVDKMVDGGKYINRVMASLDKVVNKLGGCHSESFSSWMPDFKYWSLAIKIKKAVELIKKFRAEKSFVWRKAEYDENGDKVFEGTSSQLKDFAKWHHNTIKEADDEYFSKVQAHVDSLEGSYDDWTGEADMNQRIKDCFANGYVKVAELYLVFFAQKGYEDTLGKSQFEQDLEKFGIAKGEKFEFCGTIENIEFLEGEGPYWDWTSRDSWLYTLVDDRTGMRFEKEVASKSTINAFEQSDGKIKFVGTVKYIAYRTHTIVLGGRLSKAKEKKNKK